MINGVVLVGPVDLEVTVFEIPARELVFVELLPHLTKKKERESKSPTRIAVD